MKRNTEKIQLLIADSGSTKTDWAYIDESGAVIYFKTSGLNPYFAGEQEFDRVLDSEVFLRIKLSGKFGVYFYGAGCGNLQNREKVSAQFFSKGAIFADVETDLLGSGRSVFQQESGIIGILGTGANAGYYKNGVIEKSAPSLGYILGDEGSGVWVGKQVLSAYFRNELPEKIKHKVENIFGEDKGIILNKIYSEPFPNRYIASVASIVVDFANDPWTIKIVGEGFRLFFSNYVNILSEADQKRVCITGSVASLFSNILNEVAADFGFQNITSQTSVITGLVNFHK